jgi:hypothetical protein
VAESPVAGHDGGVPAFVTVWAVELGRGASLQEYKGTLSVSDGALLFTPKKEEEETRALRIPFGDVAKVKRLRGSPVLLVAHGHSGRPTQTAFYFVQPPPIEAPEGSATLRPTPFSFGRNGKRRVRRQNVSYLGVWNREKKAQLREWEQDLRERVASARGSAPR